MFDPLWLDMPWRVGRKLGRTIYAHPDDDPDGPGVLLGIMDHAEVAADIVRVHNEGLRLLWRG